MPKHLLDRAIAIVGLISTSPLALLAALGIKLSSPGPVLFGAARAGKNARPFTMYKLRTMHVATAGQGRITAESDPRVFGVGSLLRRTKIDEIPQLWNVLKGEMRLVGPRPEDPTIVAEHYTPFMHESLDVLPGMTSAGSLHFFADESDLPSDPAEAEKFYLERLLPRKIALDLIYARRQSAAYQAQILLRTALSIFGMDGIFSGVRAREAAEADRILEQAGGAAQ